VPPLLLTQFDKRVAIQPVLLSVGARRPARTSLSANGLTRNGRRRTTSEARAAPELILDARTGPALRRWVEGVDEAAADLKVISLPHPGTTFMPLERWIPGLASTNCRGPSYDVLLFRQLGGRLL